MPPGAGSKEGGRVGHVTEWKGKTHGGRLPVRWEMRTGRGGNVSQDEICTKAP